MVQVAAAKEGCSVAGVDVGGHVAARPRQRRRVGLVFGGTLDQAQPLLAPTYYLAKALTPFADVQQPRGGQGTAESIGQMLDNQVSVLALADVGALDEAATTPCTLRCSKALPTA